MKTLLLYDNQEDSIKWKLVDGDLRHLHKVYINSGDDDEDKQEEVSKLIFDDRWKELPELQEVTTEPFPAHDFVVLCGFI